MNALLMPVMVNQFYIRHSLFKGQTDTVRLTATALADTPQNYFVALYFNQLCKAFMGVEEPVHIVKNFINPFFNIVTVHKAVLLNCTSS